MDDTDRQLLKLLRNNSRETNVNIAKKIGLSEGAVRKRIDALVESNIITRFTLLTDYGAKGIIVVKCDIKTPTSQIVSQLRSAGATRVSEVSGEYDIICDAETDTMSQMNDLIDKIRVMKGVTSAQLFTVLKQS
jgi:DNA-binding Lrp family transcriptional regulator